MYVSSRRTTLPRPSSTTVRCLPIPVIIIAIIDQDCSDDADDHQNDAIVRHTIGVILMIVGVVGAVLSIIAMMMTGMGKHRTVVDDGRGNVVRREDTYI